MDLNAWVNINCEQKDEQAWKTIWHLAKAGATKIAGLVSLCNMVVMPTVFSPDLFTNLAQNEPNSQKIDNL